MIKSIILKAGREKSLLRRHPWIFSGAISNVEGEPQAGETVAIQGHDNTIYGWGAYSPHSQITARVWTFESEEEISSHFFRKRLKTAIIARMPLIVQHNLIAYRLVHAESDGIPGLIIDRYSDFLVCQFLTAGVEYWKRDILAQLKELAPHTGIYERSDVSARAKEGLAQCTGALSGEEPPELLEIWEGAYRFMVDVRYGHKTGFYLDQRDNRLCVTEYADCADVLNCFAYTGGFGIAALKADAKIVTNIESSSSALQLARRNVALNELNAGRVENVEGDVFAVLRQYRNSGRQFDVIVLDPPKFAGTRGQIKRASRGYKDINLLAFKLLRLGGILITFSCSGVIAPDLFQKIVADAALDAGREAHILRKLTQAADHPTSLNFPEGSYLKGLVCRVL